MVARGLEAQGEFGQAGELWAQAGEPGQAARSFLKVQLKPCQLHEALSHLAKQASGQEITKAWCKGWCNHL